VGFSALVLVGCSGKNDLTGPSNELAPAAASTQDMNGVADVNGLPNNSFSVEHATTESNDWKKADVIFPKRTKFVQFHFEDLYADDCNRGVRVIASIEGSAGSLGTYVVPDSCNDLLLHRAPNPEYYIGRQGPENYSSLRPESPLKDGDLFTLRIKVERADH